LSSTAPIIRVVFDPASKNDNPLYEKLIAGNNLKFLTQSYKKSKEDLEKGHITAIIKIREVNPVAFPKYAVEITTSTAAADRIGLLQSIIQKDIGELDLANLPQKETYAFVVKETLPGRVYRNEAVSARSNCFFHQIEGLYIDKGVSFADLKQTLYYFVQQFFGEGTKVRFRSSYFPFTEPSAEMDIWAGLETEENRRLTKGTGWLEVLGCGMVHPNVLEACDINSSEYTGFAFGMGIDRITMLKYGINDIRDLFVNDKRLLSQFSGV
jgi:hypothetical protein